MVIAPSLWLMKLTVYSQTPIKAQCGVSHCAQNAPLPQICRGRTIAPLENAYSISDTSSVRGAHCCQLRAARFASAGYFRHWGHFLDAVSKQCFPLLPSSPPSITTLFNFIWGKQGSENKAMFLLRL